MGTVVSRQKIDSYIVGKEKNKPY